MTDIEQSKNEIRRAWASRGAMVAMAVVRDHPKMKRQEVLDEVERRMFCRAQVPNSERRCVLPSKHPGSCR